MITRKGFCNLGLSLLTLITCGVLVSYRYNDAASNRIDYSAADTLKKYVNPDTFLYEVRYDSTEEISSAEADSFITKVKCDAADTLAAREQRAVEIHTMLWDLAKEFYKAKEYAYYKAVAYKADSCFVVADQYETNRLKLEKQVEEYESGSYGDKPKILHYSLQSKSTKYLYNGGKLIVNEQFKPLINGKR